MVTKVMDAEGNLMHDCAELGCAISWDGYALADQDVAAPTEPTKLQPTGTVRVAAGEPVPGGEPPDPKLWRVEGDTAYAIAQPAPPAAAATAE